MRPIDADKLRKEILKSNDAHATNGRERSLLDRNVRILDEQPTIDAVEVVRCKDCQIHNHCIVEDTFLTNGIKDGYCRAGKRR